MSSSTIGHRRSIRGAGAAIALIAALLIGCYSPPPAPRVNSGCYDGPPITLERTPDGATVVMKSPGGGWQVMLDRVSEVYGKQNVFISIRRPNPKVTYAVREVDQRVLTTVLPKTPAGMYARVLPYDAKRNDDSPYLLVAEAAPLAASGH